jgi:sugar/nucleoside kinase (ribokinase family)
MNTAQSRAIACGGNWCVDLVKVIDVYPEESSLANILNESMGGGGCAHNVILSLARLDPTLELYALGVIGQDTFGDYLWEECRNYPNIRLDQLRRTSQSKTSYTDVFNVLSSGRRTFFHHRGANQFFSPENVDLQDLPVGFFHLGYLLLLDSMDRADPEYQTVAGRFLAELQRRGIKTSIDLVSENSDRFTQLVPPALKFVDYCIMNDFESSRLSGIPIRQGEQLLPANFKPIAQRALDEGVREFVVIHFPEGAYLLSRSGEEFYQPSFDLPPDYIVGTTGAGDSFCAGLLYGLSRQWEYPDILRLAVSAGAMNLRDLTTVGGIGHWTEVEQIEKRFPYRSCPPLFTTPPESGRDLK